MGNFKAKLAKIVNKNTIKNIGGRSLTSYIAFLTSILLTVVIIFIVGYVINHIKLISISYNSNIQKYANSLSSIISDGFSVYYTKSDIAGANSYIQSAIDRKMLSYAYVIDLKTDKVVYSSVPGILNKRSVKAKSEVFLEHQDGDIIETATVNNNYGYVLMLGITSDKVGLPQLNDLLEKMKILIIFCLSIGMFAAAVLSKVILRPIDDLTVGVKKLAAGQFDVRLNETKFREINVLVKAYNKMASQLQDLYESLESKVKERTIALEKANIEIKETQAMIVHSEKMRSLGELVAGIAHEINNPVNFIYGNIMILDKYVKDVFELVNLYVQNEASIPEPELKKISKMKADIDIDFIKDDVHDLIRSCIEGTERTKNIILDLKNFSRMEEMVLTQFNIPKEIDTTLNILNNKYKNRIKVTKDYEANVPKIEAFGGQLNQVFMNILDNAQYAIKGDGEVYIGVHQDGEYVKITFKDSGEGIKKEDIKKVFEPFYTTKPPGQGTGLGMSITYRVIKNHNGEIDVDSDLGKGTTFTIKLPINCKNMQDDAEENHKENQEETTLNS